MADRILLVGLRILAPMAMALLLHPMKMKRFYISHGAATPLKSRKSASIPMLTWSSAVFTPSLIKKLLFFVASLYAAKYDISSNYIRANI